MVELTRERTLTRDAALASLRLRVLSAARRRLSPADAEDLTQEVLLLLTTKYADIEDPGQVVALALGILRKKRADLWRKSARRGEASAEDAAVLPLAHGSPLADTVASDRERLRLFADAAARLEGRCRKILRRKLEGLSFVERQEFVRTTLEDQALFDTLLEEEGLRELLADPEARQHVLAQLEQPDAWQRLRAWLRRPATVADPLTVAAPLVVALVAQQVYQATRPARELPAATRPAPRPLWQAHLDRLAALPPSGSGAWLALEGHPAGTPLRVSPGERHVQRVSHAASSLPGTCRLRLVVAPADLDLAAASPDDIEREAPRLTLVDLTYETERP